MYVCMYGHTIRQSVDQPGKVANPIRTQLKRENECFTVPVRAREFRLARLVRLSRPSSACSFSTLGLNLVLTHGIPPAFGGGIHSIFVPPVAILGQSRVHEVMQMRTDGGHCRESAGTGPAVVLKVVPVKGAAFPRFAMDHLICASLFPHLLLI